MDLSSLFTSGKLDVREDGPCPACRVERGVLNRLRVVSVIEAEAAGMLIVREHDWVQAEDTQLVCCPACKWHGYPPLEELLKWGADQA